MIYAHNRDKEIKDKLDEIELVNEKNEYRKIYYESEISELKKKNKALYDSIKGFKDQVSWLVQFKYEKEYDTGVVVTKPIEEPKKDSTDVNSDTATYVKPEIKEYTFSSELNDTMNYRLTIGALSEPYWYRLHVILSDKFTIVNKDKGEMNDVTIGGQHQGTISDVTVFTKKEKETFWDRFAIGPSVSYSYDPRTRSLGPTVGISITYNLLKKKKK